MKRNCKDHLGNVYSSKEKMCEFYKVNINTFNYRIRRGYTLEEALTNSLSSYSQKGGKTKRKIWIDHKGNTFCTEKAMAEAYGITLNALKKRLARGLSLCDALTREYKHHSRLKYKFNGKDYSSMKELTVDNNMCIKTVERRLHKGFSINEALNNKKIVASKKPISDHIGNTFDSIESMCRYYDIPRTTYRRRLERGWELKDILTIPKRETGYGIPQPCCDHFGNKYNSVNEMCKAYNIPRSTFSTRIDSKWSLEEALTIPRNMYIGEYRVAECLKRLNVKFYHDCTIKTIFTDLGISIDWNDFLSELQSKLGSVGYNWSKKKIQRLRPDFVLYTDEDNKIRGVIEFDGEQHQNYVEFFFKTIEEFYKRNNIDFVKQSFWEYINIPMLRIRHDQIDMIDDMVQDFINKPQNYIHNHNTYLSEEEYWSILTEQKRQIELAFAS